MFENLREASEPAGFDEAPRAKGRRRVPERRFFGMTAAQRFVLSLLLFGAVVVMGIMCLVVTARIYI